MLTKLHMVVTQQYCFEDQRKTSVLNKLTTIWGLCSVLLSFPNPTYWSCIEKELGKSPAINPNVFDHAINKQDALMQKEMLGQQMRGISSLHTADCSKGRCTVYSVWSGKSYSFSTGKRLSASPLFIQEFSDTCDLCLEKMWLALAWNVWFCFGGTTLMLLCSILFYLQ